MIRTVALDWERCFVPVPRDGTRADGPTGQTLTAAATWAAETLARACLAHHRACCAASDRLPSPFAAGDGSEAGCAREEAEMRRAADAADAEADIYEREQAGYLAQIGGRDQQAWIVQQIQQQPECRAAAETVVREAGLDSLEVFAFGAFERPRPSVRVDLRGYHLTEVGALFTVARSHGVPVGAHPATDLTAYHYVAPAAYVDEWCRRMAHEYGSPASDAGIRAAIEAHRRGDELPPAEWADRPAWTPPSTEPLPEGVPAYEPARRRGDLTRAADLAVQHAAPPRSDETRR